MSAAESKAIFLSYASQDAEAARRMCDALCAAGVEVWFDQSEPLDMLGGLSSSNGLREGDAWDQKIRKQIKECEPFLRIFSANLPACAGYAHASRNLRFSLRPKLRPAMSVRNRKNPNGVVPHGISDVVAKRVAFHPELFSRKERKERREIEEDVLLCDPCVLCG